MSIVLLLLGIVRAVCSSVLLLCQRVASRGRKRRVAGAEVRPGRDSRRAFFTHSGFVGVVIIDPGFLLVGAAPGERRAVL